jgi:predicted cupin superfamily sugar epimerase
MKQLSPDVQQIVKKLELEAHPEGGFFRRTYLSKQTCTNAEGKTRAAASAIYFLIPEGHKSHLHRLKSDEIWHFYEGASLTVVQISPQGEVQKIKVGLDWEKGELPQYLVPAGYWFGSYSNGDYSLVGCTVSPGFVYEDFELGKRDELIKLYPHASSEITHLTY